MQKNKTLFEIMHSKKHAWVFLIYFVFFLLLFVQFPLNKSIGMHCDGLLGLVFSNSIIHYFESVFTGIQYTVSMYPADNVFIYGENSVGTIIINIVNYLLGCNEVTNWFIYIVILFTLNSFGFFLVSYQFSKNFFSAIISGFFVSAINFVFINIDDIHVFFYFFTFLSLYYLLRYQENHQNKFLFLSVFFIAFQIYTSLYVFVYGSLIYLVFFAYVFDFFKKFQKKHLLLLIKSIVLYLLIIIPFVLFYLKAKLSPNYFDPNEVWGNVTKIYTLKFVDVFRAMPNNLIYKSPFLESSIFFEIRRSAFLGFLFTGISLFFLIKYFRSYFFLVLLFILGLILSTSFVYEVFPFMQVLRVPYRSFYISVIALSFITSIGISRFFEGYNVKKQFFLAFIILLVHFLENIPYPFPLSHFKTVQDEAYKNKNVTIGEGFNPKYFKPDDELLKQTQKTSPESVFVCLPSKNIFGDRHTGSLTYSREIIYMIHQTYFKRNIINGLNGYYPKTRVALQNYIEKIPEETALDSLKKAGTTHLLFYKNLVLTPDENLLEKLKSNEKMNLIIETKNYALFKVI